MWRRCHNGVITPTIHLNLPLTGNFLLFQILIPWFSYWSCACSVRGKQGNWIHRNTGLASSSVHSPESNLRSRNYRGRTSELCVLGIEKQLVYFQDAAGLTAVNKVSRLTRLIGVSCSFITEMVLTGLSNWPILHWERLGPPTLLTYGHRNTETNKCRNVKINKCRNT